MNVELNTTLLYVSQPGSDSWPSHMKVSRLKVSLKLMSLMRSVLLRALL